MSKLASGAILVASGTESERLHRSTVFADCTLLPTAGWYRTTPRRRAIWERAQDAVAQRIINHKMLWLEGWYRIPDSW